MQYLSGKIAEGELFRQGLALHVHRYARTGEVGVACKLGLPFDIDGANGAVALFGDNDFALIIVGFGAVVVSSGGIVALAVQEENDVGVLFDGAGVTQIAQQRTLVGAGGVGTAELRAGHDRDFEFEGDGLELGIFR